MEYVKYIAFYLAILVGIWVFGAEVANTVKTHEVVEPEKGVKCIVVSRMFNTSVDCWKDL